MPANLYINLDTSDFDRFLEKWECYKSAVSEMPSAWAQASDHIGAPTSRFEGMLAKI